MGNNVLISVGLLVTNSRVLAKTFKGEGCHLFVEFRGVKVSRAKKDDGLGIRTKVVKVKFYDRVSLVLVKGVRSREKATRYFFTKNLQNRSSNQEVCQEFFVKKEEVSATYRRSSRGRPCGGRAS